MAGKKVLVIFAHIKKHLKSYLKAGIKQNEREGEKEKNDTRAAEPKLDNLRQTSRFNTHSCYYSCDQLKKGLIFNLVWRMAEGNRLLSPHLAGRANKMTLSGKNERARGELVDETKTKMLLKGWVKLCKRGCRLLRRRVFDADLI